MLQKISLLSAFARIGSLRIPLAVAAAAGMLFLTETAYRSQTDRLATVVDMGRARLLVTYALQRVTDAESGKRGYLLVGGDDYLAPYNEARKDVAKAIEDIRIYDQRAHDPTLDALEKSFVTAVDAKLAEMSEVLRLHDEGRHEAALEVVRSGVGRELMVKLRTETNSLMAHRNTRIQERLESINDLFMIWRIAIGSMTLISLSLLVMFIRLGRQVEAERELQRQALKEERDKLEVEVEARIADLRELTRHLQTAREDERGRLARELHDELGALLTAAKLDVAVIKPKVLAQLPEIMPKLAHLTEMLNSGIALKRRIIEDLSPSALKTLGLVPSLEILIGEVSRSTPIRFEHDLHAVRLSPDEQLVVYRMIQESITNGLKYAQASLIKVSLVETDAFAVVTVEDNGKGFETAATPTGSHGIRGMRFRVEATGGQLSVWSEPGKGARMQARIPLQPDVPPDLPPAEADFA
jgi:signal transduction histidine kinase